MNKEEVLLPKALQHPPATLEPRQALTRQQQPGICKDKGQKIKKRLINHDKAFFRYICK